MGWMLAPVAAFLFYFGLTMTQAQQATSKQGAGDIGVMDQRANFSAKEAEVFAYACYTSAASQSGLISSNVAVTMPAGVIRPASANCMTTANGSGRNVFGYIAVNPCAIPVVLADAHGSSTWFKVTAQGVAQNLERGETAAVSGQIPVGDLVNYTIAAN